MSWERNGPNRALIVTVYQVGNYFSRRRKNYPGQKDKKCPWCVRQGWCRFYSHNVAINCCSLVLPGLSLGFATWWGKLNLLSIMYHGSPTSWSTLEMGPYVIHPWCRDDTLYTVIMILWHNCESFMVKPTAPAHCPGVPTLGLTAQ